MTVDFVVLTVMQVLYCVHCDASIVWVEFTVMPVLY